MTAPYEYTVIRIVPSVQREEFVNAGVLLYCKARRFLAARICLDDARVLALWPDTDLALLADDLALIACIAAGDPAGGPIASLPAGERFRWLASPRNTMIQMSPVHAGLCTDPAAALDALYAASVA